VACFFGITCIIGASLASIVHVCIIVSIASHRGLFV